MSQDDRALADATRLEGRLMRVVRAIGEASPTVRALMYPALQIAVRRLGRMTGEPKGGEHG